MSSSFAINQNKRRKVYHYERNPQELFDVVLGDVTRSFDRNSIILHRDFYLIRDHSGIIIPELEVGEYDEDYIGFSGQDTLSKTFNITFSALPIVTVQVEPTGSYNINAYITSITTNSVTVGLSAPHSGNIRYRAINAATYPAVVVRNVLAPSLVYTASAGYIDLTSTSEFADPYSTLLPLASTIFFSTYDTNGNNDADVAVVTSSYTTSVLSGSLSAPITNRVNFLAVI